MEESPLLPLLQGLTANECGCCGRVESDPVAELLLVEAMHVLDQQLEAKREQERSAWAEARAAQEAAEKAALSGARG
jgi:hypothetical protein